MLVGDDGRQQLNAGHTLVDWAFVHRCHHDAYRAVGGFACGILWAACTLDEHTRRLQLEFFGDVVADAAHLRDVFGRLNNGFYHRQVRRQLDAAGMGLGGLVANVGDFLYLRFDGLSDFALIGIKAQ